MSVTRRQRDSTIKNSQEAMIGIAAINRGSFHSLLFSLLHIEKEWLF